MHLLAIGRRGLLWTGSYQGNTLYPVRTDIGGMLTSLRVVLLHAMSSAGSGKGSSFVRDSTTVLLSRSVID